MFATHAPSSGGAVRTEGGKAVMAPPTADASCRGVAVAVGGGRMRLQPTRSVPSSSRARVDAEDAIEGGRTRRMVWKAGGMGSGLGEAQ